MRLQTNYFFLFFAIFICFTLYAQQHAHASNAMIARIQKTLLEHGYNPGPIDGVMGEKTTIAIKKFQRDSGIRVSGKADRVTLDKLGLTRLPVPTKANEPETGTKIISRNRSGGLLRTKNCEPGQYYFIGEMSVPCGATIVRDPNEIGGDIYSSDSVALCVLKLLKEKPSGCDYGDAQCFRKFHLDAIQECSK